MFRNKTMTDKNICNNSAKIFPVKYRCDSSKIISCRYYNF